MEGRQKQVIINDLMGELNAFGGHITNIQKAIEVKGVTSSGKLFNFPDEIGKIETTQRYSSIIKAFEKAKSRGYTEYELVDKLDNLPTRNHGDVDSPVVPSGDFDPETATEILPKQFYGKSDLEGALTCPNVTKVGANAFAGCEYSVVTLPKATEIDKEAFANSQIKVLNIPLFVWKDSNLILRDVFNNKYGLNKIVVADNSVPPDDISINNLDLKVYNHDESKKWDIYKKVWVNI